MAGITKTARFLKQAQASLTDLGLELRAQLEFIREVITEDRINLQEYKELHGDLFERVKKSEGVYGPPLATLKTPLVTGFRTTIKSLLDSLNSIESKLSDDPPHPKSGNSPSSKKSDKIGDALESSSFNADDAFEEYDLDGDLSDLSRFNK